jgi:glycosyltransferase involved in cell wall biosynthesis
LLTLANGFDNPIKGLAHLVKAFEYVPKRCQDNISLAILGDSDIRKEIFPAWLDVHVVGRLANVGMPQAYSVADVTVVPSLYESFGLVATESMACGTPVVAYRTSGLAEQVTDKTGRLAEPFEPASLGEAMLSAIQNKEDRKRKGRHAKQRAHSKYDISRFLDGHRELYSTIASE